MKGGFVFSVAEISLKLTARRFLFSNFWLIEQKCFNKEQGI